jgi:hypothetical protein
MLNNETTRPKRKLILSRETVQRFDPVSHEALHQQSNSAQQSNQTNGETQCTPARRYLVRRL